MVAVGGEAFDGHVEIGDGGAEEGEGVGGVDGEGAEVVVEGVGVVGAVGGDEVALEDEQVGVEGDGGCGGGFALV